MTIEMLQKPNWLRQNPEPYILNRISKITCDTDYGYGYFATCFDNEMVFVTDCFRHVKNADTGKYYVKDGKWIAWLDTYTDETQETDELEEKVFAAWQKDPVYGYACSKCGYEEWRQIEEFCPQCGAKMILEEKENV